MPKKEGAKVALMYNVGSDFLYNRIHYAHYLQSLGYEVTAILPDDGFAERIEQQGVKVVSYQLKRNSANPLGVFSVYRFLKRHFIDHKYDILHTFRSQPNIIGSLAAKASGIKTVVCHVTGLGIIFSNTDFKSLILRFVNLTLYSWAFKSVNSVVVQNPDDYNDLEKAIPSLEKRLKLIKGSGINPELFDSDLVDEKVKDELRVEFGLTNKTSVITFVSRLLWHKGIKEIVDAAKIVYQKHPDVLFLMVGYQDENNPFSVDKEFIDSNNGKYGLRFIGGRNDVKNILAITTLYIFPSYYREGIPRSVLEAMSMKLPIVTTNSPGCSLTVDEGINGKLVEVRNSDSLANAILEILEDSPKQVQFGINSRDKLKNEFAEAIVFKQFEMLYHS